MRLNHEIKSRIVCNLGLSFFVFMLGISWPVHGAQAALPSATSIMSNLIKTDTGQTGGGGAAGSGSQQGVGGKADDLGNGLPNGNVKTTEKLSTAVPGKVAAAVSECASMKYCRNVQQ